MAPYSTKACLYFASKQLPPQKWKSMSHTCIPDPRRKKKAGVHSKTRKKAKVWKLAENYVEQGINLNVSNMGWQMGEDLIN